MNVVEVWRERTAGADDLSHHPYGKCPRPDGRVADGDLGQLLINQTSLFLNALRHLNGILRVHRLVVRDLLSEVNKRFDFLP